MDINGILLENYKCDIVDTAIIKRFTTDKNDVAVKLRTGVVDVTEFNEEGEKYLSTLKVLKKNESLFKQEEENFISAIGKDSYESNYNLLLQLYNVIDFLDKYKDKVLEKEVEKGGEAKKELWLGGNFKGGTEIVSVTEFMDTSHISQDNKYTIDLELLEVSGDDDDFIARFNLLTVWKSTSDVTCEYGNFIIGSHEDDKVLCYETLIDLLKGMYVSFRHIMRNPNVEAVFNY